LHQKEALESHLSATNIIECLHQKEALESHLSAKGAADKVTKIPNFLCFEQIQTQQLRM
jgi:hypothetical protein